MAVMLKDGGQHMQWYKDELLHMAKDLGLRLLPAFNTSSGLPYPRVRRTVTKNAVSLEFRFVKMCQLRLEDNLLFLPNMTTYFHFLLQCSARSCHDVPMHALSRLTGFHSEPPVY